ncbi:MAG: DUF1572 family protein [Flavobacteriales bacterium]|nr:DUF1572 family protein [Flavobacteriales bacterium]
MFQSALHKEIISQSLLRFHENHLRVDRCVEYLTDDEIWDRENEFSNSVGNLIIHLIGNFKQYIMSGLRNEDDSRNRISEFIPLQGIERPGRDVLMDEFHETCERVKEIMRTVTLDNLIEYHSVQGFKLSGFGIILNVVEHFSYHTGQIASKTKALRNQDLGFYAGFDLNVRNIRN